MALAGLQGLDSSLVEAARIDGARLWQVIWHIKLPLLMPILMITLLMRLIDALRGPEEKEKLGELFGTPDRWGQTLRARLWTHASVNVRSFAERTEENLSVPCTFDLNVSATKYFYALEGGEVPLLFLFSGTIFYQNEDDRLQIQQVSWNKECTYRMPISAWQEMMDQHYPNTAWLSLERDLFERLYAFRRREGLADWDQTIARLLPPPAETKNGNGEHADEPAERAKS